MALTSNNAQAGIAVLLAIALAAFTLTAGSPATGSPAGSATYTAALAQVPTQAAGKVVADPTNGPLLYPGFQAQLRAPFGGDLVDLDFNTGGSSAVEFSPDGALIAVSTTSCVDPNCTTTQSVVTVHGNDGTSTKLQAVSGPIWDLTWSADQSQIAVLLYDNDFNGDIWRIPLDGSAPSRILGSTDSFRVEIDGIDWSPTAETISFIGTPLEDDGSSLAINTDQIYTVGSEGTARTKYSVQLPECADGTCRLISYAEPTFSPDGTQVAAYVVDETDTIETVTIREYLGRLGPGQYPTQVTGFRTLTNPDNYSLLRRNHPVWSTDGTQVLYSRANTEDAEPTARIVTTTGTPVGNLTGADYLDWQPCPTGTCASWNDDVVECTIEGSPGRDRLVGTAGDDIICGLGDSDVLIGAGGNDTLYGGDGQDDLVGGPGQDSLQGDAGPDSLRGDEGDDLLVGGTGIDVVTYFTARQKVTVDLGKQRTRSTAHGTDRLLGVEGAFGSKAADDITGSSATNHLFGGPGNDTINGAAGTDYLNGSAGVDTLNGGRDGDLLEGEAGRDTLDGAADRDACYDKDAKRISCELGGEKDPRSGKPPGAGPDTDTVEGPSARSGDHNGTGETTGATSGARTAAGGLMTYWNLGNGDFLVVYNLVATQQLGAWANATGWENQACRFIRAAPPIRGACTATGVLNSIAKYQMQWFLWNAKRNGDCAVGILDWGRHGVNQFKKRWKTRPATYARYNTAVPSITPGTYTDIKGAQGTIRVPCT